MPLKEIFEEIKAKEATKVFINKEDAPLITPYPPIPLPAGVDMACIGRGGGVNWYHDAKIPRGTFRVE